MVDRDRLRADGPASQCLSFAGFALGAALLVLGVLGWLIGLVEFAGALLATGSGAVALLLFVAFFLERRERRRSP